MSKIMGHGFAPSVCEGCPHHTYFDGDGNEKGLVERAADVITGGEGYKGCGLCGCPTAEGLLLDKFQAVPEDCPRKAAHKRESGPGGGDGIVTDGGTSPAHAARERRETRLSYFPPGVDGFTGDEVSDLLSGPCERSAGFNDEDEYELAKEISMAVADIISGAGHYTGHDISCCPECGHEDQVQNVAFPGRLPEDNDSDDTGE